MNKNITELKNENVSNIFGKKHMKNNKIEKIEPQ